MRVRTEIAVVALGLAASACGDPSPEPEPFRVKHVVPGSGAAVTDPAPLFLNQAIVVYLSRALDPMSVSGDTLRLTDAAGQMVEGRIETGTHSITFVPRPPLRATLDDGSFRPDASYRLEVAGFPRANALRSRDGRVLEKSVVREFRAVAVDGGGGLTTPFLPEGTQHPFVLRREFLKMAADSSTLQVSFSRPLLPSTVRPAAFEVYRVRAGRDAPERLTLRSARTITLPRDAFAGCTVELAFAGRPVRMGDHLFVRLQPGDLALREYGGASLVDDGSALSVPVLPGERLPLVETDFADGEVLPAARPGALAFEMRQGRMVPRVRAEAGSGRLGVFAPKRSLTLYPGQAFDRGDGVRVRPQGGTFDFSDVYVPPGVEVRLRASEGHRVLLRASGSVRIEGSLVLEGTFFGQAQPAGVQRATRDLLRDAWVAVVAAGDISVAGAIRHEVSGSERDRGASPLTLLCGGRLHFGQGAAVPRGTVLATEPGGMQGAQAGAPDAVTVFAWMRPTTDADLQAEAIAWTPWYPIPATADATIEPLVSEPSGDLEVAVQVADPDPLDPTRPLDVAGSLAAPEALPLDRTMRAPTGGFVRFRLRATVSANTPLPSLARVSVFPSR